MFGRVLNTPPKYQHIFKFNDKNVRLTGGVYENIDVTDIDVLQQTFTCSKSTIETLENGVEYIQS